MKLSSDFKIVLIAIVSIFIFPLLIYYLINGGVIGNNYSVQLPILWLNLFPLSYPADFQICPGMGASVRFGWPFQFIRGCDTNILNIHFNPLSLGFNFIIFLLIGKFIFGKKNKPEPS